MTNRDLLLSSLAQLKLSYEKMRLPDFFNNKFNHLHRCKDRKWDAAALAKEIERILEDVDSVLEELGKKQKVFREEQEARLALSLVELNIREGRNTAAWLQWLRNRLPRLSRSNLAKLLEFMAGKERKAQRGEGRAREKTASMEFGVWQDRLRAEYESFFSLENVGGLESRAQEDSLSLEMLAHCEATQQNRTTTRLKLNLRAELSGLLEARLKVKLAPFGSSFTLFGVEGSDLDLAILPKEDETRSKVEVLQETLDILTAKGVVEDGGELVLARMPVLKVVHAATATAVDLVVETGDPRSVRTAHLFLHYNLQDWRLAPLLLAVRRWARGHGVNQAVEHSLSSHVLTILTIHYLQVRQINRFSVLELPSQGGGLSCHPAGPAGQPPGDLLRQPGHDRPRLHRQVSKDASQLYILG